MDAHVEYVAVFINQADRLLFTAVNFYCLKSAELSDTMIHMNDIISRMKVGQLADIEGLFFFESRPDFEFMIAFKYLVVGKEGQFEIMVVVAFVEGE